MDIQSANRQHPVPQNVMEVEFKLIGDLTIRQFTYLLLFGILSFLAAYSSLPNLFKIPLVGLFIIGGISFAFIPLNDIPLDKWFVNYIKAILRPRFRVWIHTQNIPYYFNYTPVVIAQDGAVHTSGANNKQKLSLEELLNADKPKSINFYDEKDLDEKEKEFFKKAGLKNSVQNSAAQVPQQQIQNNVLEQPAVTVDFANKETINNFVIPENKVLPIDKLRKEDLVMEAETKHSFSTIAVSKGANTPVIPGFSTQPPIKKDEKEIEIEKIVNFTLPPTTSPQPTPNETPEEKVEKPQNIEEVKVEQLQTKNYEEELVNYQKHIKELNLLKQKLLKELEQNKYKVLEGKEEEVAKITVKERTASLRLENDELKNKLKKMSEQREINGQKANIEKSPFFASFLLKIKGVKPETESDLNNAGTEASQNDEYQGSVNSPEDAETLRSKIKLRNQNGKTFKLRGSTVDKDNNIIPEVIIIVKNKTNEAVRALKSNSVGEFESSTELTIGDYNVEATKDEYVFQTLNLKALDNGKGLVKLIGTKL